MTVVIRHLTSPAEARLAVALQQAVWGGDETPAHVMLTAAHNGGLLAGAYDDDVLVGFVWGFLGFDDRVGPPRLKHCSHQLGVHPAYRSRGVGFALKRFQWEFVRSQGIDLVTWTYDPLLAPNAQLNIGRLGAVCSVYFRDLYGRLDDDLNRDLPTDRFQVDLWLNSPRVCEAMAGRAGHPKVPPDALWLNRPLSGAPPLPPPVPALPPTGVVALAIPLDLGAIKAAEGGSAAAWRDSTRLAFESLFAAGYTVTGFVREPSCGVYLLSPGFDPGRAA